MAFVGRSMVRNMGIAADLGYLNIPQGLVVDLKDLERLPADRIALVCTGSQGEPLAALSRMANRDHPIRVTEGDTVLMASSLIPGNENAIYRVINELTRWGANVVHKGNAKVHVSGHASAGELAYCYNIIKPRNVLPVHGEWRHLRANADIAIRTGIHPKSTLIAEDGSVIDLVKGRATITGTVPAGLVFVDGTDVGGTTEESLHVRRTLAEEGVLTIICIVDPDTGKLVGGTRLPRPRLRAGRDGLRQRHAGHPEGADQGDQGGHRGPRADRGPRPTGRVHLGTPQAPAQPADHPGHRRRVTRGVGGWWPRAKAPPDAEGWLG